MSFALEIMRSMRGPACHASSTSLTKNWWSGWLAPVKWTARTLYCILGCLCVAPTAATAQITHPAVGTPERAEILDAVRAGFQSDTAGPIEFVVHRINVWGDVAFGDVTLQRPGGGGIDWNKTKFAEDNANGQFDPAHSFFLASRSAKGWKAVEYSSGPTDIVWDGWQRQYDLPDALFER